MAIARMRPRFEVAVNDSVHEVGFRLREALEAPDAPCVGSLYGAHAVLKMPDEDQRFWSPQLSIDLETRPSQNGTRIRGLFGPRPAVWTLFMALYAIIGFSGSMGLAVAYSQWSLDRPATFLWTLPLALVLATAVYGLALLGQRLGEQEMRVLRAFLDEVIAPS